MPNRRHSRSRSRVHVNTPVRRCYIGEYTQKRTGRENSMNASRGRWFLGVSDIVADVVRERSPFRYASEDILSRTTRSHTETRHGICGSCNGYVKVTRRPDCAISQPAEPCSSRHHFRYYPGNTLLVS